MNKLYIMFFASILFADEIPIDMVKKHTFSKSIKVNAKIIQLSDAKQSIMSVIDGRVIKYFVKEGDKVEKNEPIAKIDSVKLLKISSSFLSYKRQLLSMNKNFYSIQKLYKKGLASQKEVNELSIKKDELSSKLTTLKSQLENLGIDIKSLKKPISYFTLYAQNSGVVSKIFQPLQSVISQNSKIVEIANTTAYYLKSYIPIKYAKEIRTTKKISFSYHGKTIQTTVKQILPEVDETTQRIIILSSIDEKLEDLFVGSFVPSTIYFSSSVEYLAIKKSALSFVDDEWVVFKPKEEEEHHEEDEHEEHDEHQEVPYEMSIVNIVLEDESFVAIEGLKEGDAYVSDKAYYVKSMLLKSALGGHGH